MRKIEIIGNVCKTPETKTTTTGKMVTTFDVAVRVDSERSDFYRVNAWGKLGDNCAKYLDKGRKVFVRGDLTLNKYESRGEAKYSLDVSAAEVEFLSPREEPKPEPAMNDNWTPINNRDLPF